MSKCQDKSNSLTSRLPMDVEERLTYLFGQAQKYSPKSLESRKAKTQITCLIQESGLLSRQKYDFPEDVYRQGKQNLLIDICHNIHNYDTVKGEIATQIESKFIELLLDYTNL